MVAGIEEMENLDSSENFSSKAQCKRSVNATKVKGNFWIPRPQMEQQNCLEETTESENPL